MSVSSQCSFVCHLGLYSIQRRDPIMTWSVILSVYGADPIAEVKLLISPFRRLSLDYKSIIGFSNNFNLHAIISTSLILIYIEAKNLFCCIRRNL